METALLRVAAQRLVDPAGTPVAAVRHLLALQGQDDAGAIASVALRTETQDAGTVEAAYDAGEIVRSWPMRGTLHVVAAEDLGWLLDLLAPRVIARTARRRAQLGLDDASLGRARRVAERLLAERPVSRAELTAAWADAGLAPSGGRGYHMLFHLALRQELCFGPTRDGEQLLVSFGDLREPRRLGREAALAELVGRYFRSHGPGTLADLTRWSGLTAADARAGLAGSELAEVTDGRTYYLDPQTEDHLRRHRDRAEGVLLLPGFDELLLGYTDRTATLPPEFATRVVPGGNGVFRPTVLRAGQVIGTWALVRGKVQATPFAPVPADVALQIDAIAARLPHPRILRAKR